ncbi:MAG: hypothetical protein ACK53Y_00900, partial [bacterium]
MLTVVPPEEVVERLPDEGEVAADQSMTEMPQESDVTDRIDEAQTPLVSSVPTQDEGTDVVVPTRRSARIAGGIQPPQRYILLTRVKEASRKPDTISSKKFRRKYFKYLRNHGL